MAWGLNTDGQSTVPATLGACLSIAAVYRHSVVLRANGTVTAFGRNTLGQCTIPATLGASGRVGAGDYHSLALLAGSTPYCDMNDIPDLMQLAAGAPDADADGTLDSCEHYLWDFDLDGVVGGFDLAFILSAWGLPAPHPCDVDGDGVVNGGDLTAVFSHWGTLP